MQLNGAPMSIMNLYQYDLLSEVVINIDDYGTRNLPMNNKDIVVYKGATKRIYFNVRNYDGLLTNIEPEEGSNVTLTLRLLVHNQRNQSVLITKELIKAIENPNVPGTSCPSYRKNQNVGKYYCDINVGDIQNIESGRYTWTVYQHKIDSGNVTDTYLLTDQNNAVDGFFWIKDSAAPIFVPSINLGNPNDWMEYKEQPTDDPEYRSSSVAGSSQKELLEGIHTLSFNFEDYSGTITVQGSLMNEAPVLDQDWFTISVGESSPELEYTNFTGIDSVSFKIQTMWVRVIHKPSLSNTGEITKVLYRS